MNHTPLLNPRRLQSLAAWRRYGEHGPSQSPDHFLRTADEEPKRIPWNLPWCACDGARTSCQQSLKHNSNKAQQTRETQISTSAREAGEEWKTEKKQDWHHCVPSAHGGLTTVGTGVPCARYKARGHGVRPAATTSRSRSGSECGRENRHSNAHPILVYHKGTTGLD